MIEYANKLELQTLAAKLRTNLESREPIFIHNSCRTELRNASRRVKPVKPKVPEKSVRLQHPSFDFKSQCFYCGTLTLYTWWKASWSQQIWRSQNKRNLYSQKNLWTMQIERWQTCQNHLRQTCKCQRLSSIRSKISYCLQIKFRESVT